MTNLFLLHYLIQVSPSVEIFKFEDVFIVVVVVAFINVGHTKARRKKRYDCGLVNPLPFPQVNGKVKCLRLTRLWATHALYLLMIIYLQLK